MRFRCNAIQHPVDSCEIDFKRKFSPTTRTSKRFAEQQFSHDGHMLQNVWMIKPGQINSNQKTDIFTSNWITAKKEFEVTKMIQNALLILNIFHNIFASQISMMVAMLWMQFCILFHFPLQRATFVFSYLSHSTDGQCIFSGRKIQFVLITFNRN